MQQQLQVFSNTEFGELGVIEIGGKPYFPATRCAEILGYEKPHDAVIRHCRDSVKYGVIDALGRMQQTNFITEGDLYRLLVRSHLPAAERFERWVFDEVLPSIRKHELYAADELLANPDLFIQALQALKTERAKTSALAERAAVQEQQIAEMKPKAGYYDVVLACKNAVTMRVIAKDYGWSAQRMNAFLHDHGIQYKQGGVWLLYQNHAANGYTDTKTYVHPGHDGEPKSTIHTYWTQKGRLFIYEKMKAAGYLPLIERGAGG
ncbi:MAG: phage antirepressor KilAC domain-containing protein [Oscillospiraceae bacterium]|jgi:prophage antirepressor-like protein|nr:phage antirepressor KilAC domain-containing protein [Oscillospiraceae bacterium]